jgi:hypothetical protein
MKVMKRAVAEEVFYKMVENHLAKKKNILEGTLFDSRTPRRKGRIFEKEVDVKGPLRPLT